MLLIVIAYSFLKYFAAYAVTRWGGGAVMFAKSFMDPHPKPTDETRHFVGHNRVPAHFVVRSKNSFDVGMTFHTPFRFRLQREGLLDGLAKDFGLSHELQTGDSHFDASVYLSCDDRWLGATLAQRPHARACVLQCLNTSPHIEGDGSVLWLRFENSVEEISAVHQVAALRQTLAPPPMVRGTQAGRSIAREVVAELVVISVAAIGFLTGVRLLVGRSHFLDLRVPFQMAMGIAAVAVVVMLYELSRWLRQSSWSHRVVVETGIVGLLGFPLGALALVAHVNERFGHSAGQRSRVRVRSVQRYNSARRGLMKSTFVSFEPERSPATAVHLYQTLQVDEPLASTVTEGQWLTVEIATGALGLPYYRAILPAK